VDLRFETPSTQQQYEQWVTILNEVSRDVFDVDEIQHFIESDDESAWLLALCRDKALGCGVGRPSSIQSSLYAMVRVLPEHRAQGVATQIYEALSQHAHSLGRASLWGRVRQDDTGSRDFARNRGFREAGREYEVVLDTALADTSISEIDGIALVSLTDRPDLERSVYEVDCEVGGDVARPEGDDFEGQPFPRWREQYLEGPGAVPNAMIAALAGDEVVATRVSDDAARPRRSRRICSQPCAATGAAAESPPPSSASRSRVHARRASSRSSRRTTRRTRACVA
jgi:GNAT superfamily N-acetyltransferase